MKSITTQKVQYWRNSLADGQFGKGVLSQKKLTELSAKQFPLTTFKAGALPSPNILFSGVDARTDQVSVVIYAKLYRRNTLEHGTYQARSTPDLIATVVFHATLTRNGRLFSGTTPMICRDLLEPLEETVETYVVSSVANQDEYLNQTPFAARSAIQGFDPNDQRSATWPEVIQYVDRLHNTLVDIPEAEYSPVDCVYIAPAQTTINATKNTLKLYDHIRETNPALPLLDALALAHGPTPVRQLRSSASTFTLRLGHMDPKFPLATAQRDAISHYLQLNEGEVLAVNGPPGTGKTTLLQSLIASLWVSRAIEKGEPPVIVAVSANNQAVTNVIDSFGKVPELSGDCFTGRWLPDLKSYGIYHPSQGKRADASKNGYFIDEDLPRFESALYVSKAEIHYLAQAQSATGCTLKNVNEVLAELHEGMRYQQYLLDQFAMKWDELIEASQFMPTTATLSATEAEHERAVTHLTICKQQYQSWLTYRTTEPLWYTWFSWIGAITTRRIQSAKLALWSIGCEDQTLIDALDRTKSLDDIDAHLKRKIQLAQVSETTARHAIDDLRRIVQKHHAAQQSWDNLLREAKLPKEYTLTKIDEWADTAIRHRLFMLATHYWEGRWLQEIKSTVLAGDEDKKSVVKQMRRWRRLAKLAPCNVLTVFMAPKAFTAYEGQEKPLYNFIDLLIVDEAGQVTPEAGAAVFSLASRALIVGDIWQIEPVWSIAPQIDAGNLAESKLLDQIDNTEARNQLHQAGFTASQGSVMKMAQQASPYHYKPNLDRGMYLYEHRRCADTIIRYCNDLCYKGELAPMRGHVSNSLYPPMAYLDVPGKMEVARGSRKNTIEADTIAAWIAHESERLTTHYQEPLSQIVAVVTPFKAQAQEIRHAITRRLGEHEIVVGTVHALQGAERKVVIFSPTYTAQFEQSKPAMFFDNGVNMLNVAVSRAKDAFLVFGDMAIFNPSGNRPSNLLARHLFELGGERITLPAQDEYLNTLLAKTYQANIVNINGVTEHNQFLVYVLTNARKRVEIVSPWISGHVVSQLQPILNRARSRGIEITVYTDTDFNAANRHQESVKSALQIFANLGISVVWVKRVHAKQIMADDVVFASGSYNWLSASQADHLQRHDSTIALVSSSQENADVRNKCQVAIKYLNNAAAVNG